MKRCQRTEEQIIGVSKNLIKLNVMNNNVLEPGKGGFSFSNVEKIDESIFSKDSAPAPFPSRQTLSARRRRGEIPRYRAGPPLDLWTAELTNPALGVLSPPFFSRPVD